LNTIEDDLRAVGVCIVEVENQEKWRCMTGGRLQIVGKKATAKKKKNIDNL